MLALTIGAALVTVLLFGAGPAFAAARRDFGAAFGRSVGTQGSRARPLRTALVVAEIALTVVLLAGAGLLLRSYAAVLAVDPGFDADGSLVADTLCRRRGMGRPADRDAFYQRVLERVRALPGVESAGLHELRAARDRRRPFRHASRRTAADLAEIQRMRRRDSAAIASNRGVSPGYLETLGVPLVSGRFIDARDSRGAPGAAVINQTMARTFWPDQDPLGRRFRMGMGGDTLFTVVGVVGDMQAVGLDVPAVAEVYVPLDQLDVSVHVAAGSSSCARAATRSRSRSAVRQAIREIDADQPVPSVRAR